LGSSHGVRLLLILSTAADSRRLYSLGFQTDKSYKDRLDARGYAPAGVLPKGSESGASKSRAGICRVKEPGQNLWNVGPVPAYM
jgi:hypothetical protein